MSLAIGGALTKPSSLGYFFAWQTLVEARHSPPAASQSALFLIVESDLPSGLPPLGGLADGDVDEPLDPPVVGCGRDLRSAGRRSQRYSGPRPRIDHCHVIDAVRVP